MTEKPINGKALYTPKGAAFEYGHIGCNFYTGCPHGCEYCYLKRGAPSKQLGGTDVKLKKVFKNEDDALSVFMLEVEKYKERCQRDGIFFSFTTDPMIKETIKLTWQALWHCVMNDVPVWVLTKDANFVDEEMLLWDLTEVPIVKRKNVHFGFTLTGHDEMEPKASSNSLRISAMNVLKEYGYSTFASIEPVIDWDSAEKMVMWSIKYCDHYKIGLRSGVKKDYYAGQHTEERVRGLVEFIEGHGKTVYLKRSVRRVLGIENWPVSG